MLFDDEDFYLENEFGIEPDTLEEEEEYEEEFEDKKGKRAPSIYEVKKDEIVFGKYQILDRISHEGIFEAIYLPNGKTYQVSLHQMKHGKIHEYDNDHPAYRSLFQS